MMDEMHNVNVGFMTFSGQQPIKNLDDKAIVPVRFPMTFVDEPARHVFGEQAYVQSESRPLLSADDAEEDIDSHNVVLDDAELEAVYSMATDMTPGKMLISQIGDNADDAMEFRTGRNKGKVYSVGNTGTFKKIGLGGSGSTQTLAGLRFDKVKLPPDANILKANLLFTANADNTSDLKLVIHGVSRDDAESFKNASNDISSESNYPKTTASKDWEPRVWIKEEVYSTPDIGEIVQEIVDLSDGGTEGYTIAFTIKNPDQYSSYPSNKTRSFYTRDSSASKAPQLSIVYEVPEDEGGIAGVAGDMTTVTQKISQTSNDATEYRGDGGGDVIGSVFTSNKSKSLRLGNKESGENIETLVGLRFTNLEIPQGAIIVRADVEFTSVTSSNEDDLLDLMIYAQDSSASTFYGENNNLSNRYDKDTSESVHWNVPVVSQNEKLVSADLSSLVQKRVENDNWVSADNDLVLLFARANSDETGSRYVYDFTKSAAKAPILRIGWVKEEQAVNQKVGLRFQTVQIPRGATVISARIDFTSADDDDKSSSLKIHGEAYDEAIHGETYSSLMFTSEVGNISNRKPTSNSVNWNNIETWHSGELYSTPDLKDIVQEIVLQEKWCGANAMSFIISENGDSSLRNIKSFDDSPKNAPVLHVEYDLDTVPEDTCINEIYSKQISHRDDEAEELTDSHDIFLGGKSGSTNALEMTTITKNNVTTQRLVGLRFPQIPIERKTKILKAELFFTAQTSDDEDTTLYIRGEKSPSAKEFKDESANLSSKRPKTTTTIQWKPYAWTVGQKYSTVNIAEIVQEIVDQPGWRNFNDMAFFISGSGLRRAVLYHYDPSQAVILRIQMEGGKGVMTARQRIKDMINGMTIGHYTPLVDAIYEAGQYYRGEQVTHGKDRFQKTLSCVKKDDQKNCIDPGRSCIKTNSKGVCTAWNPPANDINRMKNNRVSHSGSWDQETGELDREKGCTNANLNAEACVTEKILEKGLSNDTKYIKPQSAVCQPNFLVFLTDGEATINSSEELVKALPNIELEDGECQAQTLNKSRNYTSKERCGVDMVRYLHDTDLDPDTPEDQNVITYTIGFSLEDDKKGQKAVEYLKDWAEVGGGSFYEASSADELHNVFMKILSGAIVKSASFAAPSLSINVFNQLYHDDDIYVSLFKPSPKATWFGNIKKYSFCNEDMSSCTGNEIMDATHKPAVGEDYKIVEDAVDRWNPTPGNPDGNTVTEGGAGAKLKSQDIADRNIYTNVTEGNELSEVNIENEALTASKLGVSEDERDTLINWMRGYKYGDQDAGKRDWYFYESLHSSPGAVTVSKASNGNLITKIFVATNGGEIRALDAETGKEDWVFIPKEMLSIQNTLMEDKNSTDHTYGIDGNFAFSIEKNDNGTNSVKLFIGQRRGGRNIYAMDVTYKSNNYKPTLMWTLRGGEEGFERLGQTWSTPKLANVRFGGKSKAVLLFGGGYEPETQDDPQSSEVTEYSNAIYMVDPENGELLWWISNTGTGADLELEGMKYSIPSDLTLIDSSGDDIINRIYVGDTGGNVWRIDLGPKIAKGERGGSVGGILASLGSDTDDTQIKRRFFYAPDVVMLNDPDYSSKPDYDMVFITSGYRPDPLGTYTQDRFYALRDLATFALYDDGNGNAKQTKDEDKKSGSYFFTLTNDDLFDATDNVIQESAEESEIQANKEELNSKNGWFIDLKESGEKGLSSPVVFNGQVYFTTFVPMDDDDSDSVPENKVKICHIPSGNSGNAHTKIVNKSELAGYLARGDIVGGCSCNLPEGEGRLYTLDILNGGASNSITTKAGRSNEGGSKAGRSKVIGKGIPSSPQIIFRKNPKKKCPDGSEPLLDGTCPCPDGSEPFPDGTCPCPDGSKPLPDGTCPDGKCPDGSEPPCLPPTSGPGPCPSSTAMMSDLNVEQGIENCPMRVYWIER
jgi:type IV pilus assembly protein PilY1